MKEHDQVSSLVDFFKQNSEGKDELNPKYEPLSVYIRIEDRLDFLVID